MYNLIKLIMYSFLRVPTHPDRQIRLIIYWVRAGSPYLKGRMSTVDLLVFTSSDHTVPIPRLTNVADNLLG
jgi:hypothetical protein